LEGERVTERTGAVRQLLSFAKTEFGEHLTELLLSGYDVEQVVLRRRYTVNLQGDSGREITVEVATDASTGLPAGWEPLVLVALLKLLLASGRSPTVSVSYSLRELLKKLSLSAGDRRAVEQAIEDYYHLSFIKHEVVEVVAGEGPVGRTRVLRPIVEWERREETASGDRLVVPKDGRVRFNAEFVEQLKERSLLGIEWNLIQSLIRQD